MFCNTSYTIRGVTYICGRQAVGLMPALLSYGQVELLPLCVALSARHKPGDICTWRGEVEVSAHPDLIWLAVVREQVHPPFKVYLMLCVLTDGKTL